VNLPSSFNTFFIFAAYAISAKIQGLDSFSVSQAISTLTALTLLGQPLGSLLASIPPGWGAVGCFTRIQDFLLQESRTDVRSIDASRVVSSRKLIQESDGNFELQGLASSSTTPAIHFQQSGFGWSDTSSSTVKDVTADIKSDATLTIVVGPVGCGKSTLLKGLLGETPMSRGSLSVPSSYIAYCDQTPWIINGTIRKNIIAASDFDNAW
jgi:ATP-binding cassette, subfamily C (CFTR/MRP), member 1